MRPALSWALGATVLLVGLVAFRGSLRPAVREVTLQASPQGALPALCPPGSLPDDAVCIPAPPPAGSVGGRGVSSGVMPRRADRPLEYTRYRLPLPIGAEEQVAAATALPGDAGSTPLAGVSLRAPAGTPVVARGLEGQQGAATVVFAGQLVGLTLVTHHVVRAGSAERQYLVVIGSLAPGDLPAPRQPVTDGAKLGKTSATPLYLDVRLLRPGVDPWALGARALMTDESGISVDARNVFTLSK